MAKRSGQKYSGPFESAGDRMSREIKLMVGRISDAERELEAKKKQMWAYQRANNFGYCYVCDSQMHECTCPEEERVPLQAEPEDLVPGAILPVRGQKVQLFRPDGDLVTGVFVSESRGKWQVQVPNRAGAYDLVSVEPREVSWAVQQGEVIPPSTYKDELLTLAGDIINYVANGQWENLTPEAQHHCQLAVDQYQKNNFDGVITHLNAAIGIAFLGYAIGRGEFDHWHHTGYTTVGAKTLAGSK